MSSGTPNGNEHMNREPARVTPESNGGTAARLEGGRRIAGLWKTSSPEKPLVSIITPVLNCEVHLEQTILSVLNQTYDNVEYIVVDGGSTDGSLGIIRKYDDRIDYWVRERDEGISDAFNKGIRLSGGDFIGIIGADDWYDPDAIGTIAAAHDSIVSFAYGACTYLDGKGKLTFRRPDPNYRTKIAKYMPHIHHPTVFVRRETYERYGLFSVDYRYAMDYEFLLRLHKAGCVGTPIQKNLAYSRASGVSNRRFREARQEAYHISRKYGQHGAVARFYFVAIMSAHYGRKLLGLL